MPLPLSRDLGVPSGGPPAVLLGVAAVGVALLGARPASALESHLGHTRADPPPSGYWYPDVPGGYNPWTDDIQEPLLTFPASNAGVTRARDIQIEPAGWDMHWYGRVDGPSPSDAWSFVDLGTLNDRLTGTNWVHGPGHAYEEGTWVLEIRDEGFFDPWRVDGFVLPEYRGIAVEVSNTGDTEIMLDSDHNKWLGKGHHSVIALAPGDTDILYHPFRRDESHVPEDVLAYFDMIHPLVGYPGGHLYESEYTALSDIEGPWTITATVAPGVTKGDVRWTINRMFAGGRYEVPDIEELTDPDYEPWTDDYGQWRHDDWVGKVWGPDDCVDQYAELAAWLDTEPGPTAWNTYGGWATGPQLEATGWFRAEKFPPPPSDPEAPDRSRWWFVDPLGNLFLSQGSLHMSANTPRCGEQAGYDDDTFPEAVYFPRLRAMGFNTAGGNSSWKWHKGRMPYTYQIKTGWAPIRESDFLDGGEEQFEEAVRDLLFGVRQYAEDPYCIGFIVDNELSIRGGDTLSKDEVEEIYFGTIRRVLDELSAEVGRPPMLYIDPASNGGRVMAETVDVLAMHRMDGYYPATWKDKFSPMEAWGVDKPVGQFTFTMGALDAGVAHYGLTMFLTRRHRAQGMDQYMRKAYAHTNNIANHAYYYMKADADPLTEFRSLFPISDATDYPLAERLGPLGDAMYGIHMGDALQAGPALLVEGGGYEVVDGDLTPSTLDGTVFEGESPGEPSVDRSFTLFNIGDAPLEISAVTLSGDGAAGFEVLEAPEGTLETWGSATLLLRAAPGGPDLTEATVLIESTAGTTRFGIEASGLGAIDAGEDGSGSGTDGGGGGDGDDDDDEAKAGARGCGCAVPPGGGGAGFGLAGLLLALVAGARREGRS